MSNKLPSFRDWDGKSTTEPYGWDYGHGKKRKYPTFKTKKEKLEFKKDFETRWFSERHAVLSFDPDRWRKYLEIERRLKEAGADIEKAASFYIEHSATRRGEIPTFSRLHQERLKDLERKGSASLGHAQKYGQEFIAEAGDKPINMYTRDDVQGHIDSIAKAGWSRSKCKGNLNQIKAVFSNALADGYITTSPAARITLPTTRGEKRLELIDPADLRKLLNHAWENDRPMAGLLAILFFTGMRTSMIGPPPRKLKRKEFIRLDMIDFGHRAIVIPQGIMKKERQHIIEDAPECLWSWLGELKASDFGIPQTPFNLRKNKLLEATGVKWPPNLHRRSFGSYLGALKDRDYAAQIMADRSESVFVKHYQVPAFKKTAEEYVSIFGSGAV